MTSAYSTASAVSELTRAKAQAAQTILDVARHFKGLGYSAEALIEAIEREAAFYQRLHAEAAEQAADAKAAEVEARVNGRAA